MVLKIIFFINKLICEIFSFFSDTNKKGIFLSQQESINELLRTNKSLIRWGDGESSILTGGSLYFQRNKLSLFLTFWKILINYNNQSKYLIALPNEYLKESKNNLIKYKKYKIWKYTRYVYLLFFKKNLTYLDSFIFREDSKISNSKIEKLWEKEMYIFFIHSNYKYYTDFKNQYTSKKIIYIPITSANSYKLEKKIISLIKERCISLKISKNEMCVLISSGPSAKSLVYKLSNSNFRALDMGHYFDFKYYNLKR